MWRSLVKASFVATLRELVPELESKDLKSAESGVRAQALRSNGTLIEDFFFKQNERALHVLNAPSPAATASLEIARYIVNRIEQSE
jgi:L-2-hydroxyglutarate oxidase